MKCKGIFRYLFIWKKIRSVSFAVFAMLLMTTPAHADILEQINYQGKLTDATGIPVANGSYDAVFKIYDASSGGTLLWTGTHTTANSNPLTVTGGIFSTLLGSGTGNTLNIDFSTDTYYLGVTIGADAEMTPRKRIGAVPQAFNAKNLKSNGYINIAGLPTGTGVNQGTVYINPLSASSGQTVFGVAINGTQKLKLTEAGNLELAGAITSGAWNGTAIATTYGGTGTATLGSSGALAYSNGTNYAFSGVGSTGQALVSGGTGAPTWFAPTAGSALFAGTSGILQQDNAKFFWDDGNDRLGIGTSVPGASLDVTSGQLRGPNGSVIAGQGPGISFTSYPNDGIASNGDNLGFWQSGVLALDIADSLKEYRVPSNYKFAFASSTNNNTGSDTSFYRDSGGVLRTPGSFLVDNNVGIGDMTPASALTVGFGDLFQVNSSGAIVSATGVASSGSIQFSGFTSNGGPLYTNGSGVLAQTTAGTSTQVLHGGTTPTFGSVSLTADISGTLTVANGGTGATTLTGILKGNGTGAFTAVTAPSGALVGDTDVQTLTNKTLTSASLNTPTITTPTIRGWDGWMDANETWTYASADGPTQTFTVGSDVTAKYSEGMRLRYEQSQALTSYWSMDTNSSDSVGSNNGTDTSVTYTAGKFSNAATFNGTTSKTVVTDASSMKPTGEFTLGLWIKTSSTGTLKGVFQSYSVNPNIAGFGMYISAANVLQFNVGNNTSASIFSSMTGTTNVTDNAWHYVVVSYRNNYAQMYVDGKLEVGSYSVAPAYAATNYVRIGVLNLTGTDTYFMNGQIDDVFLINGYALDQKTIKAKYDAASAQSTGSLTLTKYGLITAKPTYSSPNTTITMYSGTDHTLTNAAVSATYYSNTKAPFNFPLSPTKWTVEVSDVTNRAQASPTSAVWYNIGSISASMPIGVWDTYYQVFAGVDSATASTMTVYTTLSTANNTENVSMTGGIALGTLAVSYSSISKNAVIAVPSKTTYYLNTKTNVSGMTGIYNTNNLGTLIIRFKSAYL